LPRADLPRIALAEMNPALADYLSPRVARLGYLGEFFQCAAHQPDALLAFQRFTDAAKGGLSDKLVETIALTAAQVMNNRYERHQHERLAVRLGFGRAWVAEVIALGGAPAGQMSDHELLIQRFVVSALETQGHDSAALFGAVVEVLGAERAVAVLMVLGRYAVHALAVNTLGLVPPVPSIFEDGFDA
jgi:hypothetical protein